MQNWYKIIPLYSYTPCAGTIVYTTVDTNVSLLQMPHIISISLQKQMG